MKTFGSILQRKTRGHTEIQDLTSDLQELVRKSGVRTGQMTAMVIGSTAALSTVEFEPGLVQHDLAAALERIAPQNAHYHHEAAWHDDNGHAHVRATLTGCSIALPILDGKIPMGTWQQVILLDFDTRARERQIAVTLIGE